MKKRRVVIGILGSVLDKKGNLSCANSSRWDKWRPTVGLCSQPNFTVDRLELIHHSEPDLAGYIANDIAIISSQTEVRLTEVPLKNAWDFEEVYTSLLDFADRYPFDTENEEYFVHITTGTHVAQICWFLLTESHHLPAKLIQTRPAKRKENLGPLEFAKGRYSIIDLDLSRYDLIASRFQQQALNSINYLKSGIATKNDTFNRLIEEIERVAIRSAAPILMTGPTGAGKSFLARRIYELKHSLHQLKGNFIEVNCATLRGDSAMSTLFGHVKGSFTGAQQDRAGLLRAADNGVLFLDEIGELGLDEQAMLLKAIEEKRFLPFGSDKEVSSQFQLIAGTHRDLRESIKNGAFREDLYARINLWTFRLPGLAERPEDIEPNLDYELAKFAAEQGSQTRFNLEARKQYCRFATSPEAIWKGNFRELSASVTRMATLAESGKITEAIVKQEVNRLQADWGRLPTDELPPLTDGVAMDLFDYYQLQSVIHICKKSKSLADAGRTLFAVSRAQKQNPNDSDRLKKYLARFNLSWDDVKAK
jgi:transcriptional regulatory protein RtcR